MALPPLRKLRDFFGKTTNRKPSKKAARSLFLRPYVECLETRCLLATSLWTGAGLNNNWSTAANWAANVAPSPGDDLVFLSGASRLSSTNDFAPGTDFNSITFAGGGYTLGGNAIALDAGIQDIANADPTGNTVNLSFKLNADGFVASTYANANLFLSGGIDNGGHNLIAYGSGNINISGIISGDGGLIKSGPGNLLIGRANTYAGPTTLYDGTTQLYQLSGISGSLGVPGDTVVVNGGATLALNVVTVSAAITLNGGGLGGGLGGSTVNGSITLGSDATIGSDNSFFGALNISGAVDLNGNTLTVNSNGTVNFNGVIYDTGDLVVNGAQNTGTVNLTVPSIYSGSTTVKAGTLTLSGAATLASTSLTVNAPGTLRLDNSITNNTDRLPDTAALTLNGGTFAFIGNNATGAASSETIGAITLAAGHSTVSSQAGTGTNAHATLTAASLVRNADATVNFSGPNLGSVTNQILFATAPATVGNGGGILPYASVNLNDFPTYDATNGIKAFTGYVTSIATAGANDIVRLTGSETVSASKSITALLLAGSATINGGATLTVGTLASPSSTSPSVSGFGILDLAGTTLTPGEGIILNNGDTLTVNNALGSADAVVLSGTGTTNFAGDARNYAGGTILNSGTVELNTENSLGTGTLTLVGGAIAMPTFVALSIPNSIAFNNAIVSLGGGGAFNTFTFTGTVTLMGTNTLSVDGAFSSATISGNITGSGTLVKRGGNPLTLGPTTASDYSGGTILSEGALIIGADNTALGTGPLTLGNASNSTESATIQTSLSGGVTLANPIILNNVFNLTTPGGAPLITFSGDGTLTGLNFLTVNSPLTFSGSLSGTGGLIASGSNTLTLSGANTYYGATGITGGPPGTGALVISGSQPNSPVGVNGGVFSGGGSIGFLSVAPGLTDKLSNPGGSKVIQTAAGASFGSGASLVMRVSGYTTPGVDFDQLNLGSNGLFLSKTILTLDLSDLTSAGTVTGLITYGAALGLPSVFNEVHLVNNVHNFGVSLAYTATGLNVTFIAPADGGTGLPSTTKVWSGASFNNNWTNPGNWVGGVAPSAGDDLIFGPGAAQQAMNSDLAAGTQFHSITFSADGYSVTGNSFRVAAGVSATELSGTDTLNVAISLDSDETFTSTFSGGSLVVAGPVDTNGHTLTIDGSGTTNIPGTISGSGGLVKNGPGTFQIGGNNTYTGLTTINAGFTAISSGTALGASGVGQGTIVNAGATLQATGALYTVNEPLTLNGPGVGGGVAGSTRGALEITGAFITWAGPINLGSDATISIPGGGFPTFNGNIDLGAHTLSFSDVFGFAVPVNGVISGTGNLVLNPTGTNVGFNLTAANTYTGSTTVYAGNLDLGGNGTIASQNIFISHGTLTLDNSAASVPNRIPATATVTLSGGTLSFAGNNAASASSAQTIASIVLAAGHSSIQSNAGSGAGASAVLTFGSLTRNTGATVDFSGANLGTASDKIFFTAAPTTIGNNGGILPFATFKTGDFATYDATNGVKAFTAYASSIAAAAAGDTVKLQGTSETVAANKTINALIINSSNNSGVTINPGATLTLGSGAVMITEVSAFGGSIAAGTGGGVADLNLGSEGFIYNNAFFADSVSVRISATNGVAFSGQPGNSNLSVNPGAAGNDYTGGTFINDSSLSIDGTTPLGAASGAVHLYGGSLDKNFFASSVTLANPFILDNSNGGMGSLNLTATLTLNGANVLNVSGTSMFSGQVTGSGSLTKTGGGNLILTSASNNYSGGTVLNGGTLILRDPNALATGPLTLTSGALQTDNVGGLTLGNAIVLDGANASLGSSFGTGTQPLTLTGPISVNGVSALTVNVPVTASGVISGSGSLRTSGQGTLTLTGNNTLTGATALTGGNLVIDGSQGSSPVAVTGGTLAGTGNLGFLDVGAGGTVSPGDPADSIGILAAAGADFSGGGALRLQIAGYGTAGVDYDRLDLGAGLLTVGGSSKLVLDLSGLTTPGTAQGVVLFGARAGNVPVFDEIDILNNPNNYSVSVVYTDTGINLIIGAV
jgi:autotransporter-associated beta strand protein